MSTHNDASEFPAAPIEAPIDQVRRTVLLAATATICSVFKGVPPTHNAGADCLADMLALCEHRIATLKGATAIDARLDVEAFTSALLRLEQELGAPEGDPSGLMSPELDLWTVREVSSLLRGFAWRCVLDEHAPTQCELGYTEGLRRVVVQALACIR